LAAIDLMWSLDDLCREALSAEEEGERAFERLFGGSKRSRHNSGAHSDEMLEYLYGSLGGAIDPAGGTANAAAPVYRSLDHIAQDNPREESIARLSRRPIDLSSSVSRDQAIGSARSYREQEVAAAIRRASNGMVEQPRASSGPHDAQVAALKLVRLRQALMAAPPRAKNLLLTPELFGTLSKAPHHRRELSLLLTHASNVTIEAAAADSVVLEHELHNLRHHRALPVPTTQAQPTFTLRRVSKRGTGALRRSTVGSVGLVLGLSLLMAALLSPIGFLPEVHGAVAASALSLSRALAPLGLFAPPPLPPACHWSWRVGCVPSNAATLGCSVDLTMSRRLCKPDAHVA